MRRKLKNLKNKNGHSENGAPAQLIAEARLREHRAAVNPDNLAQRYDPQYSGWSNQSRPRDMSITLRSPNTSEDED